MWKPCIGTLEDSQLWFSSSSYKRSLVHGVFVFCTRLVFPFAKYSICMTVTLQFTKSNWARHLSSYSPSERPTWGSFTINL